MRQKLEGNGEGSSKGGKKGGKKGKGKAPQGKPFDGKGLTAEEGAKILVDNDMTGEYKCSSIVQQQNHPYQVFQAVAAKIGGWTQGQDPETPGPLKNSLEARDRIQTLRAAGKRVEDGDNLRNEYDGANKKPPKWNKHDVYTNGIVKENVHVQLPNGLGVLDCDLETAAQNIHDTGKYPDFNLDHALKRYAADFQKFKSNNHKKNIAAIEEARGIMLGGSC